MRLHWCALIMSFVQHMFTKCFLLLINQRARKSYKYNLGGKSDFTLSTKINSKCVKELNAKIKL